MIKMSVFSRSMRRRTHLASGRNSESRFADNHKSRILIDPQSIEGICHNCRLPAR
jgi:hypothetical protein